MYLGLSTIHELFTLEYIMKSLNTKTYLLLIMLFLSGSALATGGPKQEPPASETDAQQNEPAESGFLAWFYQNFIK